MGKAFTNRFHPVGSVVLIACAGWASYVRATVPTTLENFLLPGTQPDTTNGEDFEPILPSNNCRFCHEVGAPVDVPIYGRWQSSPKAQAGRDPIFQAALTIANQDAAFAGDLCLRCHAPRGWLADRSVPTNGSALEDDDFDGVTCTLCHRAVDPVFKAGISPAEDERILTELSLADLLPTEPGNGSYVISATDARRGPFDDVPDNYHSPVPIIHSPFHTTSDICGTCHDVSNPVFVRQPDGTYAPNTLGDEHPSLDKYEMFPVERTYSEWLMSDYATVGVDAGGVFGGNHPTGVMRTCQDCHMPDTLSYGSAFDHEPFFERPNVPAHDFNGGNTWLPDLIDSLYGGLVSSTRLQESKDRATYMLENAATLQVIDESCRIRVRVTNETGHKLPTGYPEGRRMWLSVAFYDDQLHLVSDHGHYDFVSADLTHTDTRVYEAELGMDETMASVSGRPAGPSFHFALNNVIYKDNRIPPRGFTNAGFASVQAMPVGAAYADGQYWDDTYFHVPLGATSATVSLYYQTSSKEYIEFLRDANVTNDAGDILFEQWALTGQSTPVLMREAAITNLTAGVFADADCSGTVDLSDFPTIGYCLSGVDERFQLGCEGLDANGDGDVDLADFEAFLMALSNGP